MITNLMFVMFFIIDELYHDLFLKAHKNKRITVRLIRFHRGKTLCFPLFWLNVCIKATKEKILSSIKTIGKHCKIANVVKSSEKLFEIILDSFNNT